MKITQKISFEGMEPAEPRESSTAVMMSGTLEAEELDLFQRPKAEAMAEITKAMLEAREKSPIAEIWLTAKAYLTPKRRKKVVLDFLLTPEMAEPLNLTEAEKREKGAWRA